MAAWAAPRVNARAFRDCRLSCPMEIGFATISPNLAFQMLMHIDCTKNYPCRGGSPTLEISFNTASAASAIQSELLAHTELDQAAKGVAIGITATAWLA